MLKNKSNRTDFLVRCSVCESDLDPGQAVILEENSEKTTAHITCSKCNSAVMVFISNNQAGILSIGVATDMDSSEAKEKMDSRPITADEIIDLHQAFRNGKEDLIQIMDNGK